MLWRGSAFLMHPVAVRSWNKPCLRPASLRRLLEARFLEAPCARASSSGSHARSARSPTSRTFARASFTRSGVAAPSSQLPQLVGTLRQKKTHNTVWTASSKSCGGLTWNTRWSPTCLPGRTGGIQWNEELISEEGVASSSEPTGLESLRAVVGRTSVMAATAEDLQETLWLPLEQPKRLQQPLRPLKIHRLKQHKAEPQQRG